MDRQTKLILLFVIVLIDALAIGLSIPVATKVLSAGSLRYLAQGVDSTQNVISGTAFVIFISPIYFFIAPFIGNFSDYLGRKKTLFWCMLCASIGYLLAVISVKLLSIILFILGCFFVSIGWISLPLVLAAITDIASNKQKIIYFGLTALTMVAVVICGVISSVFLDNNTFGHETAHMMLISSFLLMLFSLALLIFTVPETKPAQNYAIVDVVGNVPTACIEIFYNRITRRGFLLIFLLEIAWGLYLQNTIAFLMRALHFSDHQATQFVSFTFGLMTLSLFIFYPIVTLRLPTLKAIRLSFALMGIGMLGSILMPFMTAQWLCIIPTAIGAAVVLPQIWVLIANHTAHKYQGLLMGLAGSTWVLAWALSSYFVSLFGRLSTYLPYIVATLIISLITCDLYRAKHKKDLVVLNTQ